MKLSGTTTWVAAALSVLLWTPLEAWAEAEGESERALCIVCHVDEGTKARESVRATRTHQGRTYRFCSDRCAGAFDRDPEKYVRAMQSAPVDSLFQGGLFSGVSSAPT